VKSFPISKPHNHQKSQYMKTLICVLMLLTAQAFPQGKVIFQNNVLTPLTTNDLQGNMGLTSGVDAYRIGLYIAQPGPAIRRASA
jgi:hypothetical protein